MICSGEIFDTIAGGTGFFQHGHTYMGHPAAAACGLAVVSAILDRGLEARVLEKGAGLAERMEATFGQHPNIGDLRGRGLFRGVEIVADRETKEPFDPGRKIAATVKKAAFEAGLICYPMAGTIDGRRGDHVLLAPPFIIDDSHIGEIVDKLDQALVTTLASL